MRERIADWIAGLYGKVWGLPVMAVIAAFSVFLPKEKQPPPQNAHRLSAALPALSERNSKQWTS